MQLAFTGDVYLGPAKPRESIFQRLGQQLPPGVRLVLNFEGTLSDTGVPLAPVPDKIVLTSPLTLVDELKPLPICAVNLANNHIADYGPAVTQFTIDRLSERYPTFGAGTGQGFHRRVCEIDGVRLGFASYCLPDTSPLYADADRPGPMPLTLETACDDLRQLRPHAQYCIALTHWGDEWYHYPKPQLVSLARQLVDAGFDLVVGSHSHSVQGYERYKGRFIFYSLGNFYFPDFVACMNSERTPFRWMRRCRWGLMPVMTVREDMLELDSLHFVTRSFQQGPRLTDSVTLLERIERISRELRAPDYELRYPGLHRLESCILRYEEFRAREGKPGIIARKLMRLVRSRRACP